MQPLTWKQKTVIIGAAILVVAGLLFVIKHQRDIINSQRAMETSVVEMKQLQDGIVRSQAGYATKGDVEKFAKSAGVDLKPIQDDLGKLHAEIQGVSQVVARTPGERIINVGSSSSTPRTDKPKPLKCPDGSPCPNPDVYGYLGAAQNLQLNEPYSSGKPVPFGQVQFSAWKPKPWSVEIYPRDYSVVTVLSTDEDGRHFIHSKFIIDTKGKKYTVPISEAKFVEEYPTASFRWSPQLYLGIDAGVLMKPPVRAEVIPNIELSLFSYGKTKVNPTWMFLGVGAGYESQSSAFGLILSPVAFNVGDYLPLINNLYFGPSVSFDFGGNVGLLFGARVGL